LKAEVYKHRAHTLDELKTAIREEITAIPPDMTARVINFRKRLDVCIRSQGHHMDDTVFQNKLHVLANLMVTITFGFDEALPILLPCEIHPVLLMAKNFSISINIPSIASFPILNSNICHYFCVF
jgi:hypothetical protein